MYNRGWSEIQSSEYAKPRFVMEELPSICTYVNTLIEKKIFFYNS